VVVVGVVPVVVGAVVVVPVVLVVVEPVDVVGAGAGLGFVPTRTILGSAR
jgi:hypothetical protein